MEKLKPLMVVAVIAALVWFFVLPIFNPYGISEKVPLGLADKVESEARASGMSTASQASVAGWELASRKRFNSFEDRRYFVGGRDSQAINLGGEKVPELLAIASDEEGEVQVVVIRMQSTENRLPTTMAQLAEEYFVAANGHKPDWSTVGSESHGELSSSGQSAQVTAAGLSGSWRTIRSLSAPTMVYEEPKPGPFGGGEKEGEWKQKKSSVYLMYEVLVMYRD